jgi:hypothetical protein
MAASSVSSQLASEVIREVLSDHERNLLRLAGNGKSLDVLAKMYRQYEGPNGVDAALKRIREKVEDACRARVERREEEQPVEDAARGAAGIDVEREDDTGVPKSAGAGGSVRRDAGAPQRAQRASPPSSVPASSPVAPSRSGLDAGTSSPAAARNDPRARGERNEQAILAALAAQRRSARGMAEALSLPKSSIGKALERLEERGLVEHAGQDAYDWTGGGPGRGRSPSRVWKLVDEPEGCLPCPKLRQSATPSRVASVRTIRTAQPVTLATSNGNGGSPAVALLQVLADVDRDALRVEIETLRARLSALEALDGAAATLTELEVVR